MAIQQTKKQTDLEKRLKILRQQVYGKNLSASNTFRPKADQPLTGPSSETDISYLYKDLTKIFILAMVALGIQISLKFFKF